MTKNETAMEVNMSATPRLFAFICEQGCRAEHETPFRLYIGQRSFTRHLASRPDELSIKPLTSKVEEITILLDGWKQVLT